MEIIDKIKELKINSTSKYIILYNIQIKIILNSFNDITVNSENKKKKDDVFNYTINHHCDKYLLKFYNEIKEMIECDEEFKFNKTSIKNELKLKKSNIIVPLYKDKKFYICGLVNILPKNKNIKCKEHNNLLIKNIIFNEEFRLFNDKYMSSFCNININKKTNQNNDKKDNNIRSELENIISNLNILECLIKNSAYLPKIKIIKKQKEEKKPIFTKKIQIH